MNKIIISMLVLLVIVGCKSSTGPEDLSYVAIQFEQGEIVGGMLVYYLAYGSGHDWSNYKPIGTIHTGPELWHATGVMFVVAGKDFEWKDKKWHCKTVKRDYIEIAVY